MPSTNFGAAVAASRRVASQNLLKLSVSHAQEIQASLFGYRTYAALLVEDASAPPGETLSAAEHFILNRNLAIHRCRTLSLPEDLAICCFLGAQEAFTIEANPDFIPTRGVFGSVEEYWEKEGQAALLDRIYNDERYSGVFNENAHVVYDPEGFELGHQSGNFWQSRSEWIVHSRGELEGALEDEEERWTLEANKLDVLAQVTYRKAGRAGLILAGVQFADAPGKR